MSNDNNSSDDSVKKTEILIIGAGPTALGAASRLIQCNYDDYLIVEARDGPGGLAYTSTTPEGFLFDMGGHVIFSHYEYFDQLLDHAVGKGEKFWNVHPRESHVWMKNRWIPYPFQNNIQSLPVEDQEVCLHGIIDATKKSEQKLAPPANFDEWITRVMGEGIADIFMRPYNFKVWAVPTTLMQCRWLGERVATVDCKKVISNVLHKKEEVGWGPNSVFRFPKTGGTGGIWKNVAKMIPKNKFHFSSPVVKVNVNEKYVVLDNGKVIYYNRILSTMPLDLLCKIIVNSGESDQVNNIENNLFEPEKVHLIDDLDYSSSHIIGIGIRGTHSMGKKCWQYFPEDNCPYYRNTIFSNYAESNTPPDNVELPTLFKANGNSDDCQKKTGPYWSLMFEVSESKKFKPVNYSDNATFNKSNPLPDVVVKCIEGAVNTKLLKEDDEIVSWFHHRLEHGYPTPSLKRDNALEYLLPKLKSKQIWSRGRFGAWKYEVANQDHSVMQGVEAINNMLHGTAEMTLNHPSIVNARGKKNMDLTFTV
eukprot:g65.t1